MNQLSAWEWHDLLAHPPSQRVWKSSNAGTRWYYDPELKQISVSCGDIGLLDLAQTSSGDYTLEMRLYQGRLSGGLGLYIGAHKDEHEGREVIRYQYFEILQTQLGSKHIFMLSRNLGIEPVKSDGNTTVPGTRRALISKEFDRDFGSQRLEIKVTQNQLEYVMVNGKKLKELATPDINKQFESKDYQGGLGVWVFAADGVVQKAQFIRNDGQP